MVATRWGGQSIQVKPSWAWLASAERRAYVIWNGMPRLSEDFLQQVVFLYPTKDAAIIHARLGGTGAIVGRKIATSEDRYVLYLVSNRHVVWNAGCGVIRVNRYDGNVDIFETDPSEWTVHPDNEDIAAICAIRFFNQSAHSIVHCPTEDFLTPDLMREYDIGIGEEVVMAGRFLNHQGTTQKSPAVRFGCISVMPQEISNYALGTRKQSFAVEMRSRTGFSGSPVHVYRTPYTVLRTEYQEKGDIPVPARYQLGIHLR